VPLDESQPEIILCDGFKTRENKMGKKKVSKGSGSHISFRQGTLLVELEKRGRKFFDTQGREYEALELFGRTVYKFKKATIGGGKMLMGICDQNKNHRSETDHMPKASDRKCRCGGNLIFEDITPQIVKATLKMDEPTTAIRKPKKTRKGA
jgi:hypothetical protein